ncbi:MAG: molybdopterin-synthase adenylyltransferase MoeB [Deltaproteobacteria bacterium]|jgi:adenylyltransferase/sulfurtransferase|nr:molybdopterin-synthase adenylyltransferase MoeB [Deltaproteobacteria bacterium]
MSPEVVIKIPLALAVRAGVREIWAQADNVAGALRELAAQAPRLKKYLFHPEGGFRDLIRVQAGDRLIGAESFDDSLLSSGQTLTLAPQARGGSDQSSVGSLVGSKPLPTLDQEEITRYSRHLLLPEIGVKGQKRLKAARVLVVGAGGLGSPLALYLAAAGVGTIGLIDDDEVELSNLQRQILHSQADLGRPKVFSGRDRLLAINPRINVEAMKTRLDRHNALDILKSWDLVCDGTDNFPTRYLLNDAAAFLGLPLVYGSIFQFEGQVSVFWAREGPCYRCLYPTPPSPGLAPSCGEAGVMGVITGLVGAIQAAEAIKLIVGEAKGLLGRLILVDSWLMEFTELAIEKDPGCPLCGRAPTITELVDYELFCGVETPAALEAPGLSALELKKRLASGPPLQILDIREPQEKELFKFPGAKEMSFEEITGRLGELDPTVDTIVICKIGQRSLFAIRALKKAGYNGPLFNLKEGANAWARDVDPTVAGY